MEEELMEEGEGGDYMEQFHRNEAISAVADDGFFGEEEEEEDDYEDLYNDVNVGDGFLQSLRKNETDSVYQNHGGDANGGNKSFYNNTSVHSSKDVENKVTSPPVAQAGESSVPRTSGYEGQGFMAQKGGTGVELRVQLGQSSCTVSAVMEEQTGGNNATVNAVSNGNNYNSSITNNSVSVQGNMEQQPPAGVGNVPNESVVRNANAGNMVGNGGVGGAAGQGGGGGGCGNGTILFVGDLHWWTTDAELEEELCKYGPVKELKFFDEKASGKSKGYCQVEFFEPASAAACKEGMNGHAFNGRPCTVAFATPFTVKKMGEAQVNRNQQMAQAALSQAKRVNDSGKSGVANGTGPGNGGNYQGGDGNRGYGRGNWGRGNSQALGNRGPVGSMRNRPGGGMGGRGMMGNGFSQGISPTPPMMPPNSMMGQGFDPAFNGAMGRMGVYPGFPGCPTPPFPGMLSSFPPVGTIGLPGVAPHVNPAFFPSGMPMKGMGMMPATGVDVPNMGMWSDPTMGGWGVEEPGGGKGRQSSGGEEVDSDGQNGEVSHDIGAWQNTSKEKERPSERGWSGSSDKRYCDDRDTGYDRDFPREKDMGGHDHNWSERRHRDDRDVGRERERQLDRERERSRDHGRDCGRDRDRDKDRDRYREDRDSYADHHRYREREVEHDDEWERGRSSRVHIKSRISQEDDYRSRSRDADYGKRRRLMSE